MSTLIARTAGESHGPALTAMVEGMPSGVEIDLEFIDAQLARRQGGYGRGGRQRIEEDHVQFTAGVRGGRTMGGPVVMQIVNRDSRLDDAERTPSVYRPRPGHADLAGAVKWLDPDCRNVLERASARETAARVACGALARCLLRAFSIEVFGFVRGMLDAITSVEVTEQNWERLRTVRDASEVACPDEAASAKIIEHIRQAKIDRDTVGGLCEVHVFGAPMGLGSCASAEGRLDGRLAQAVMSIQAFKSVEIGLGREVALRRGSAVHDPIHFDPALAAGPSLGFSRPTNHAGGLEGGMTNGMPVVVIGAMKPISTLGQGMPSVDLRTRSAERSDYERSDVCALPAASVVMENAVAFEIARAMREKFAGDSLPEMRAHFDRTIELARKTFH